MTIKQQETLKASGSAVREGDKASGPVPTSPPVDPVMQRMAADIAFIRRKQAIDFYAPGIALLLIVGLAIFIFGRP